jgi:hypothetical protein
MTHTPLSHLTDEELLRHAYHSVDSLVTTVLERELTARMPALLERIAELEEDAVALESRADDNAAALTFVANEGIEELEALLILLGDYDLHPIDIDATRAELEKARKYDELVAQLAEITAAHNTTEVTT